MVRLSFITGVSAGTVMPGGTILCSGRTTSFCLGLTAGGVFKMANKSLVVLFWPIFTGNEMNGTASERTMEKIRKYLLKIRSFSLRRKNQYSPKKRTIQTHDLMMYAIISLFFWLLFSCRQFRVILQALLLSCPFHLQKMKQTEHWSY